MQHAAQCLGGDTETHTESTGRSERAVVWHDQGYQRALADNIQSDKTAAVMPRGWSIHAGRESPSRPDVRTDSSTVSRTSFRRPDRDPGGAAYSVPARPRRKPSRAGSCRNGEAGEHDGEAVGQ